MMYHCLSICFLSAVITMSEQVFPSAVALGITVTFVTKENVKPFEVLTRLRAQFGHETLWRIQMYLWSNSFKEGRTEFKDMLSTSSSFGCSAAHYC
jgi:hypothetical protein